MSNQTTYDAIVIGGGPAGMMAAGRAAGRGRSVLLVEKNDMLGRKLLISGKGRCNITNAGDISDHVANFGKTGLFLRNAFARVFNKELIGFFEKYGVRLKTERGERVFPESDRSKDILDALKKYLDSGRVKVLLSSEVKNITINGSGIKKVTLVNAGEYTSESVAICTGGLSYPKTGSTGFGFNIAAHLGHKVVSPKPALVPLVTESGLPKKWQGISLDNVKAAIITGGRKKTESFGDMLFTHFGLSGPIILDLSAEAYDLLEAKKDVTVSLNLKPALDAAKLDNRLLREFLKGPNKALKNVLAEMLPSKMVDGFIDHCGLAKDKKSHQITVGERRRIAEGLTDLRFRITRTAAIEEAIVTRGGVDTK
ncbi:MAG: aminoacetone oxidase family FAD-binding enzyme, partial [Candidatus Omnitrophota bacterium]|nr:aminoacetone oxidase family FAD-binding enzyme [Candidatus Omnitrophota bacterium]